MKRLIIIYGIRTQIGASYNMHGALGQLVSEVPPCKVNADTLHCGDTQRRHWAVRIILQPSGQL